MAAVIDVELRAGRGDLHRLASASTHCLFPNILKDLSRITAAGAAMEFLRRVLPQEQPAPLMFATTLELLIRLDEREVGAGLLVSFRSRIMALMGWTPMLHHCVRCHKTAPAERPAWFDPNHGGLVCRACGGGSVLVAASTRQRLNEAFKPTWASQPPWTSQEEHEADIAISKFVDARIGTQKPSQAEKSDPGRRFR